MSTHHTRSSLVLSLILAGLAGCREPSDDLEALDGIDPSDSSDTHAGSDTSASTDDTPDTDATGASDDGEPSEACTTADGGFACTDGVCCDGATGLEWQQEKSPIVGSWSDAIAYCDALTLDGGGWRLATISELLSLSDACDHSTCLVCDTGDPATSCLRRDPCMTAGCNQCDATVFNGAPTSCYWPAEFGGCVQPGSTGANPLIDPLTWSSSNYVGAIDSNQNGLDDDGAWYLHFAAGSFVHGGDRGWPGLARCVRGELYPSCVY